MCSFVNKLKKNNGLTVKIDKISTRAVRRSFSRNICFSNLHKKCTFSFFCTEVNRTRRRKTAIIVLFVALLVFSKEEFYSLYKPAQKIFLPFH
jgi:hypothetical protein